MSAAARTPQLSPGRRHRVAQAVYLVTAVISAASVAVQLWLVVKGVTVLVVEAPAVPLVERLVRFFSYFTVQSNLLVVVACALLARRPDRDGPAFRVVRMAGMVGITVTFVVYLFVLRPNLPALQGPSAVTDVGLHIVTPTLAILGWLLLDPHRRLTLRTVLGSLLWPAAYAVYSLIRGAVVGWYPYFFVDVTRLGYPVALRNLAGVVVLMLAVGGIYLLLDRRLPGARPGGDVAV